MIETVEAYLIEIKRIYSEWNVKKHLFFRGHSDCKYKLIPSVSRNKLLSEKEILLDFKQYAPAHEVNYDFIGERDRILADMQHYGIPTRLIDWTVAPLNALFFACSQSMDSDGEVIVFNPWKYWGLIVRDKRQEEIHQINIISRALLSGNWSFDKIKAYIKTEYGYEIEKDDIEKPFAYVANYTNKRIIHQRGCFTIHGTSNNDFGTVQEFSSCSTRLTISGNLKNDVIKELNMLYVNDYSIYPDFDGMKSMISKKGSLFNV